MNPISAVLNPVASGIGNAAAPLVIGSVFPNVNSDKHGQVARAEQTLLKPATHLGLGWKLSLVVVGFVVTYSVMKSLSPGSEKAK